MSKKNPRNIVEEWVKKVKSEAEKEFMKIMGLCESILLTLSVSGDYEEE